MAWLWKGYIRITVLTGFPGMRLRPIWILAERDLAEKMLAEGLFLAETNLSEKNLAEFLELNGLENKTTLSKDGLIMEKCSPKDLIFNIE